MKNSKNLIAVASSGDKAWLCLLHKILPVSELIETLNGDTGTSQTYGDFMNSVQAESAQVKAVDRGGLLALVARHFMLNLAAELLRDLCE